MNPNSSSFTPCLKAKAQPFVPSSQGTASVNPSLNKDARTFVPTHCNVDAKPPPVPLCRFFVQGACKKGMDCPFRHDSDAVSNQRENLEEVIDQPAFEYDMDNGIHVCFGPGASVIRLDLGDLEKEVEVNTVAISGLPMAVSEKDVEARLSPYGELCHLSCHNKDSKTKKQWYAFAQFSSPSMATNAVCALNGTSTVSWCGLVRRSTRPPSKPTTGVVSVMLRGRKRRNDVSVAVKVHWFAPSTCAWAHYSQRWQAERVAHLVDTKAITKTRTIQAKFQQPTRGQRSSFSVWLGNLPAKIDKKMLISFLTKTSKIRCMSVDVNPAPYSESSGPAMVQKQLTRFGPIREFHVQEASSMSLKRRALVRFVNSDDAQKACDYFSQTKKIQELGGTRLFVTRIFSLKYQLPPDVFPCIQNLIEAACGAIEDTRLNVFEGQNSVTLIVSADTQKSIETARDGLKEIVEGEVLRDPQNGNRTVWNRRILWNKSAMLEIIATQGDKSCTAWVDSRRQEIRVFGPDESRIEMKKALLEHYLEIMLDTQAVPIMPSEFEYLLRTGRSALDKVIRASGAKSVSLNIKDRSLLVIGDVQEAQKARYFVSKLAGGTDKMEQEEALCPVCFCSPDDPVHISCGDAYCRDCFVVWLGGSSVRDYPLECLQDGCHEKVALRDLQKRLSDDAFGDILRFAVDDHIRRNPHKYQFCLSPTCPGIYELEEEVRVSTCSTCLLEICTDCNVSHGSSSCEDYRLASLPPNQMRMKIVDDILTLRCPRCRQAFLDFDGCFALRCNMCPCGFCGWCLQDCGSDAHSHVLDCTTKPKGHRDYYGTLEQFELAQKLNRKRLLIEFLSSKSKNEQIACLASLERDLLDLGISLHESEL
eukprot:CAMPEP_0195289212 /NCGR_PEP_ID=MMETSP0707-20130614/5584_1 /TAXON_ID=33640 /ORGANISM="Asterionellopsis glacialis, Strain CCMP134" /LENGTH=872 /DNA_ID=CAMNT_0040349191 /DNA_START=201 /DNA_END=2819 /DNA_ORIENTATION=+